MQDFFGFNDYDGVLIEGAYSWQHLTFVLTLIVIMVAAAIYFGLRDKEKTLEEKNKVLVISAIALLAVETFRIAIIAIRSDEPLDVILMNLPLFLCSIQLIALPVAAFSKGRIKEAALDFVFIFGLLGAILGTIGAAQNYDAYPVLSIDNVGNGLTHVIPGFASLYIGISHMVSMKKENIWITVCILLSFCLAAMIANALVGYNYMFLVRGDGTPYDIIYNLVGGNPIIYPLCVILLFFVYIVVFYEVYFVVVKKECFGIENNN